MAEPMSSGSGIVESGDGALIHVEVTGDGPPVVLVHGWMMSSRFWVRQVEGLSRDRTVVTMDLLAHGSSSKACTGTPSRSTRATCAR